MIKDGDSIEVLKLLDDNSMDAVITDPPYGYSFMGKDWDKAVPSVEIWRECLRVLKPGAFCMVMSAPRSDVQNAMISRLMEAGFRLDFTPIYWTYASGFPKAGNVGKLVDKRLGVEREVVGTASGARNGNGQNTGFGDFGSADSGKYEVKNKPATPQAKALDGSYTGFQPKPAVEVIIVAMKPLSEKTYVDQALKNGKGITWLDDCRVPSEPRTQPEAGYIRNGRSDAEVFLGSDSTKTGQTTTVSGRFPANLLVSDDVLNGHSNYFDLDAWSDTLPFIAVPKASKSEKNKGLESFDDRLTAGLPMRAAGGDKAGVGGDGSKTDRVVTMKNHHPTVKPLKLMSYLITLTTRPGDTVLDPFVGSGTTVVAAKQLDRIGIGIEREAEYAEIARARVEATEIKPKEPEQMSIANYLEENTHE